MLTGGCYCGAIRYQVRGEPINRTICHCEMCRRTTGAPCVAWFTVPRVQLQMTGGNVTRYRSSSHGTRSFCATCGTQLTFADDDFPGDIDVSTCSLDQPAAVPPASHIFTASQVPWLQCADAWPRFARSRADEKNASCGVDLPDSRTSW